MAVVPGGQIYTSTDSGVTWTARDTNRAWFSVASSFDGSKLVAVLRPGQVYSSTDSGLTWTARDSSRVWWSVASSSDGSKLVAGEWGAGLTGGLIYTSVNDRTTVGTAGSLVGSQYDAIALQYIGNNLFLPLSATSFSGSFRVN